MNLNLNLAETIYRKSRHLSPERARQVIDFIDFLIEREQKQSKEEPSPDEEDKPPRRSLLARFEEAGLVGCIDTDEELSTTYKEKIDYSFKHGD